MRPLRFLLPAFCALLLFAPAAGAAPAAPAKAKLRATIGIADQKADVFTDPRFTALQIKNARRSVGWDFARYDWQIRDIDQWLSAARVAGVTPLITFARARSASRRHKVPTVAQIRSAFRSFRQKWPWVKEFVASNESNHSGEPTYKRPDLAAKYYKAMKQACKNCKILAADLLDIGNMSSWVRKFKKAAKQEPKYWGLHNYVSANRLQTSATRRLLKITRGEIWFTEVGGLVKRRTNFKGKVKMPEGRQHAAKVTKFIFGTLARLSPRIKRVYLYHWNSEGKRDPWDSGLVGSDGKARPSLPVLQKQLAATR